MKYSHVFSRGLIAASLILSTLSPALAWETSLRFGNFDSIFVAIGKPKGKLVKIPLQERTVEIEECEVDIAPMCKFRMDGQLLWIDAQWLNDVDKTYMARTALRKAPNGKAARVGTIPENTILLVHSCQDDWCDVHWTNKRGWIAEDDLLNHGDDFDD